MRPVSTTTLTTPSIPGLTTTTIVDSEPDAESAKKAATAEQLSKLIEDLGIEVRYTREEYLQLDEDDSERNVLNDFLVLKKIPESNSPDQQKLFQRLMRDGDSAALELINFALKATGQDALEISLIHGGHIVGLEWLLMENPSITTLAVRVRRDAGHLHDALGKCTSLQNVKITFDALVSEEDIKKALSQLNERNNLKKLSVNISRMDSAASGDDHEKFINLELHKILDANPNLNSIEFDGKLKNEEIDALFASMKNLKNLTSVAFQPSASMTPKFSEEFPGTLSACTQLAKLELRVEYSPEYASQESLVESIKNHKNLSHLTLGFPLHPDFTSPDNPAGNQKIRAALIEHPGLISLNLSTARLTSEQLKTMLTGDAAKCKLHSLKFSTFNIDKEGAQVLAQFLKNSPKLEEIEITTDSIDIENFNIIADAISQNPYLTKFDFKTSGGPYDKALKIQKIHEERIQPILENNIRRTRDWAMRDKWGPAFGASENAPATAIPAEVAGLMAQHLSQEEQAEEPLGAAQRTDQKMLEILLAMRAAASAEQNATPTPNPAPNPAPSPGSSSSSG